MSSKFNFNYYNLKTCLTESNKILREIFRKRWMKLFDKTWNDSKEDAEFFTEHELGERIKNQFKSLQFQLCLET